MVGWVAAFILASAPDPQHVGSVDGLNLWVEGRGLVQTFGALSFPNQPFQGTNSQRSFRVLLPQGYIFAGWGLRLAEHRVLVGASLGVTGVAIDDVDHGLPRLFFAPVSGVVSMPLRLADVTLVPTLSAIVNQPDPESRDLGVTGRASLRLRHAAGAFVGGVGFSGEVPLVPPALHRESYFAKRRCAWATWGCNELVGRELWRVAGSAQLEYFFSESLSFGAVLSASLDEQAYGLIPLAVSPSPSDVLDLRTTRLEARALGYLSWAFHEKFGLTFDVSGGFLSSPIKNGLTWSTSLSVWFRFDERLQPRWLDH